MDQGEIHFIRLDSGPQPGITKDPLLGLMADEPELVNEVVDDAYAAREQHPLRLLSDG